MDNFLQHSWLETREVAWMTMRMQSKRVIFATNSSFARKPLRTLNPTVDRTELTSWNGRPWKKAKALKGISAVNETRLTLYGWVFNGSEGQSPKNSDGNGTLGLNCLTRVGWMTMRSVHPVYTIVLPSSLANTNQTSLGNGMAASAMILTKSLAWRKVISNGYFSCTWKFLKFRQIATQ